MWSPDTAAPCKVVKKVIFNPSSIELEGALHFCVRVGSHLRVLLSRSYPLKEVCQKAGCYNIKRFFLPHTCKNKMEYL